MFCQKTVAAITADESALTATFDDVGTVINNRKELGSKFDLVFAYGGIDFISNVTVFEFGTIFDVVFVAPQVRYRTRYKQELLADYPTIVKDLDSKIFGTMNGDVAYTLLLDELVALDLERSSVTKKHPETKNGDKNIELLVLDGDRNDRFFKNFFAAAEKYGFRILAQDYSLEALYDFHPQADFEIRILFTETRAVEKENFPKLSRRIDGILNVPFEAFKLKEKEAWFADYAIPMYNFTPRNVAIQAGDLEWENFQEVFGQIVATSEYTREVSPAKWEEPQQPVKEKKSALFGLLRWG